ncbi:hypothetical protein ACJO2E_10410 [Marinobacter sp. M1N3S26]|uniref:hypothetical protein n=1 Tax=unclassified Marinobacter TaxID=83889 RepID=UPI00387B4259
MNTRTALLLPLRVILFSIISLEANSVLIDFNDLPTQVDPSQRCADWFAGSNCVDDQYLDLGVRFEGLMVYEPIDAFPFTPTASSNAVVNWAGPTVRFIFSDDARPDYVSFDAWTRNLGGVFAWAYNSDDELIAEVHAKPENPNPPDPDNPPPIDKPNDDWQYPLSPTTISLTAKDIQWVKVEGRMNRRSNLHMDNVYFGDTPPVDVSEPSMPALLVIMGLALLCRSGPRSLPGT